MKGGTATREAGRCPQTCLMSPESPENLRPQRVPSSCHHACGRGRGGCSVSFPFALTTLQGAREVALNHGPGKEGPEIPGPSNPTLWGRRVLGLPVFLYKENGDRVGSVNCQSRAKSGAGPSPPGPLCLPCCRVPLPMRKGCPSPMESFRHSRPLSCMGSQVVLPKCPLFWHPLPTI